MKVTGTQQAEARTLDLRAVLETLAVFVAAMSALGLLAARLGMFDAPPVWMLSLLAAGLYHHMAGNWRSGECRTPVWHLALLIGVGLLFRLTPDAYVLGGQDQGVYVNMAMHLAATGNLTPVDQVLAHLSDPAAQEIYRQSNYIVGDNSHYAAGSYLPGVYATSDGLVFQFYHLFPVWMALFGDGFGPMVAVYALTFLSVVSLLFFYRLAHLITGSQRAALAAGLLLAINPLHAFFSRFPVTEVPTLAFSLMGFSFALDYWKHWEERTAWRLVLLSVLAMGCLFATRITGFLYMPIVVAVAVVTSLDSHKHRRQWMLAWAAAVVAAYVASVWYGLTWSRPYASDIYRISFGRQLGTHVVRVLAAGVAGASLIWILAWAASGRAAWRERLERVLKTAAWLLPMLGVVVVIAGAYKAYQLGYTDAYVKDPVIGQRFGLAHQGWRSVFSTSLVASAVYLSPFVFVAYFIGAFRSTATPVLSLLLFFTSWFLAIAVLVQPVLPYQPYFARYLLSEVVPYMTLLVVVVWATRDSGTRLRRILATAMWMGGLYGASLSAAQIGKSEHEGVIESINRLAQHFDQGDLVLVDASMQAPSANELQTNLVFSTGLNVAKVSRSDLARPNYLTRLDDSFEDVYLLTTNPGTPAGFREVDAVHFAESAFRHGAAPPISTMRVDNSIRVLRFGARNQDEAVSSFFFRQGDASGAQQASGWSVPEAWGVWSQGSVAQLELPVALDAAHAWSVQVEGRAYVTPKVPEQTIRITVGREQPVKVVAVYPEGRVHVRIPVVAQPGQSSIALRFNFDSPVSPRSLGYSGDERKLAFGLEQIRIVGAQPASPAASREDAPGSLR